MAVQNRFRRGPFSSRGHGRSACTSLASPGKHELQASSTRTLTVQGGAGTQPVQHFCCTFRKNQLFHWCVVPFAGAAGIGWSATVFDLPNLSVQTSYQPDTNEDRHLSLICDLCPSSFKRLASSATNQVDLMVEQCLELCCVDFMAAEAPGRAQANCRPIPLQCL